MNPSAEKSYFVRDPKDYAKIHDRLKIPGERKVIQDADHLSNKVALATFATMNMEKGTETVEERHEILDAEEALENRYKIRGDIRSSMRPTFHSIRSVGKEVNQKLSEVVDLRKRIMEEAAQHALTTDKKRDLHKQLLDAETFITQKNAQILMLQEQIRNTTTSNIEASPMLEQGRANMSEDLDKTTKQIETLSTAVKDAEQKIKDDIASIKNDFATQTTTPNTSISVTSPMPAPTKKIDSFVKKYKSGIKGVWHGDSGTDLPVTLSGYEEVTEGGEIMLGTLKEDGTLGAFINQKNFTSTEKIASYTTEVTSDQNPITTNTAAPAQPTTQTKTTPEKKEGLVMPSDFAVKAVDHHLLTINKYMSSGNKVYEQAAIDFVDKIKKQLDRCDDKNVREAQKARLDKALKKPAIAAPAAAPSVPPQTVTPTPEKEVTGPSTTETKTSPAAKKISLGAAAIAAGTLALGAVGPDQKQDQDFTYKVASLQNQTSTSFSPEQKVKKIGNVTVDTKLKTVSITGVTSPLLLKTLEKKGDYYIGSYNYGEITKYIAVPDLNTLKSLSAAKNDEEIKVLLSPFANKVLDENLEMKGVSVICGQSRTEDGIKRIVSFNFKRQGREIKEAKDGHITLEETPLAKKIFGKKYNEYVRSFKNLTLDQFRSLGSDEIEDVENEVIKLGEKLLFYKYNDSARNRKIDDLLREMPQ
jgi:hypothetical protein